MLVEPHKHKETLNQPPRRWGHARQPRDGAWQMAHVPLYSGLQHRVGSLMGPATSLGEKSFIPKAQHFCGQLPHDRPLAVGWMLRITPSNSHSHPCLASLSPNNVITLKPCTLEWTPAWNVTKTSTRGHRLDGGQPRQVQRGAINVYSACACVGSWPTDEESW